MCVCVWGGGEEGRGGHQERERERGGGGGIQEVTLWPCLLFPVSGYRVGDGGPSMLI